MRKVQALQTKLATASTATGLPPQSTAHSTSPTNTYIGREAMDSRIPPALPSRSEHSNPLPPVLTTALSELPLGPRLHMGQTPTDPSSSNFAGALAGHALPAYRAKTPEPRKATRPTFHDGAIPSSSIGKKRSAPDDADEVRPAQGFTIEGTLDLERNGGVTPRVRKSLRSGGFTPVRHTTPRPLVTVGSTSPVRASASEHPNLILDVTNSPRRVARAAGTSSAAKRGTWVGKLKSSLSSSQSGSSRTTSNTSTKPPATSRPPYS